MFDICIILCYLVPKVKAITPYNPNFNPNRLPPNCRIKFMPVGKSGHRYSPKFRQLFYGTFNPGGKFKLN